MIYLFYELTDCRNFIYIRFAYQKKIYDSNLERQVYR